MLLVEAQIMMLHVLVIIHIDDHLPMFWFDAVPQKPNPCGGRIMLIMAS